MDARWDGKRFDIVFYGASGYQGYLMMQCSLSGMPWFLKHATNAANSGQVSQEMRTAAR